MTNTVSVTETTNTITVDETTNTVTVNEGSATVVTVSTAGPQGVAGPTGATGPAGAGFSSSSTTLTDTNKVNKSIIYYDSAAGTYKADSTWTTNTLTDGGNF